MMSPSFVREQKEHVRVHRKQTTKPESEDLHSKFCFMFPIFVSMPVINYQKIIVMFMLFHLNVI